MTLWLGDLAFVGSLQPAALWTPAAITTALWLDAADASTVTTVSGNVSQWNDKSGNGRDAAQSTAGNRPAYQSAAQNGLNAVRFTAASQHFLTAGTNSTWNFLHNGTASSMFIVSKVQSTGSNPDALHSLFDTANLASANTGLSVFYDDRASVLRNNMLVVNIVRGVTGASAALALNADIITPGLYTIYSLYLDSDNATAGNRILNRLNGGAEFGGNIETAAPSTSNSISALNIGRSGSAAFYLTGDMCEILILNTQPDTPNRQRIEGYLAHKWGLTGNLPSDHPYKSAAPTL